MMEQQEQEHEEQQENPLFRDLSDRRQLYDTLVYQQHQQAHQRFLHRYVEPDWCLDKLMSEPTIRPKIFLRESSMVQDGVELKSPKEVSVKLFKHLMPKSVTKARPQKDRVFTALKCLAYMILQNRMELQSRLMTDSDLERFETRDHMRAEVAQAGDALFTWDWLPEERPDLSALLELIEFLKQEKMFHAMPKIALRAVFNQESTQQTLVNARDIISSAKDWFRGEHEVQERIVKTVIAGAESGAADRPTGSARGGSEAVMLQIHRWNYALLVTCTKIIKKYGGEFLADLGRYNQEWAANRNIVPPKAIRFESMMDMGEYSHGPVTGVKRSLPPDLSDSAHGPRKSHKRSPLTRAKGKQAMAEESPDESQEEEEDEAMAEQSPQ